MELIRDNELDYIVPLDKIPTDIHNITLTQEMRERMAFGLQTSLIENIVNEKFGVKDAKLSASYDSETDQVDIHYDYKEEHLKIPTKLFGETLTAEHIQLLINGEIAGPFIYNGQNYYVGMDEELNKLTVKTERQIGIPENIANYNLNGIDKYQLANNRVMDTKVYQNKNGQYFTANIKITADKKGVEVFNIKYIDEKQALKLKRTLDKTITDPSKLLYMPGLSSNTNDVEQKVQSSLHHPEWRAEPKEAKKRIEKKKGLEEQLTTKGGAEYSKTKKRPIEYEKNYTSSSDGDDGYTIKGGKNLIVGDTYQGHKLNEKDKFNLTNGKEISLKMKNGDIKHVKFIHESREIHVRITRLSHSKTISVSKKMDNSISK